LGVVFYELLAGQLPFQSDDAMELVHAHLALSPQSPELLNPDIPPLISEIIMKLLRKNAEDRYQSSYGLKSDLERCLSSLERKGKIDAFDLAKNDFSGKLQIPQKLYGRQKEIEYLLDAFERSSQGATELLLVAGYSGVGKSALVHEIHRPITQRRGYFIEGKFDQLQRNIPYFAFIQAFKSFAHNLLTENTKDLERWRVKIQRAVGNNGRVLTDVMPSLELIIGPQPEVTHLGASESQNRFNLVFQNFIRAISSPEHPLVIFVDDWQWADAASMNLLRILLTGGYDQYLFIIGAYRVNEVESGHPFMMMIEELREEKVALNILELNNLSLDNLNDLVSDALSMPPPEVRDLTELMYHKTQGNAFFVNQMLRSLYEESLLRFDFGTRSWTWDLEQIKALNISDNVVDLMASKVQKLPQATQNMLKLAACIGNRFNLETLAIVNENNRSEYLPLIKETLEPALMEGLIIP
ncbi:MAG: AAA family ATPase, partial [Bacteroidota bacterium]